MKLVLIGSPGAGKGTQAKILSKYFGIAHISTGDLLREETNLKTELGLKIINIMNSGELVSDDIVSTLLSKRILKDDCKKGFILDGYPRNLEQAKGLNDIVGKIDKAILINVDDNVIIERVVGRRACENCKQMYHLKTNPPRIPNICDECGSKLVQRQDDLKEVVENRLRVYHLSTAPIINFYENENIILKIDGMNSINKISEELINSLKNIK